MGYFMYLMESTASFKVINANKILKAIQNLHGSETVGDSSGQHFSWVDNTFYKLNNLEEMFKEWRWEIEKSGKNYAIVGFLGEKLGDEEILFKTISPYMNEGYITMRGEDDHIWKWKFRNGRFREVPGRIIFDDEFHIEVKE
mgnify:FL=1